MEIAIASDHGGYELKQNLVEYLGSQGHNVIDIGTDSSEKSVNFPDFAEKLAHSVLDGQILGIGICGTGLGMCMALNRVIGIRAALLYDEESAEKAKSHNNANVICFGGRTMDFEDVKQRIDIFMETDFGGGKYEERNKMLDHLR